MQQLLQVVHDILDADPIAGEGGGLNCLVVLGLFVLVTGWASSRHFPF